VLKGQNSAGTEHRQSRTVLDNTGHCRDRAEQCWTIQDIAGTEQNSAGQYRTVQERTGQYRTVQNGAKQYRAVQGQSRTVLDNTGQCRKEQNSAGQYRTVQERAEQC
jgi:hypothetical protein